MAAPFHGKGGSITVDPTTGFESYTQILSWSLDVTADTAEATDMGDTWKTYLAGFLDWTATVEANSDETQSALAIGTSITKLTLEMVDAGDNVYGAAICTGVSFSVGKDDVGKVTYAFQGNGALTYAAS